VLSYACTNSASLLRSHKRDCHGHAFQTIAFKTAESPWVTAEWPSETLRGGGELHVDGAHDSL